MKLGSKKKFESIGPGGIPNLTDRAFPNMTNLAFDPESPANRVAAEVKEIRRFLLEDNPPPRMTPEYIEQHMQEFLKGTCLAISEFLEAAKIPKTREADLVAGLHNLGFFQLAESVVGLYGKRLAVEGPEFVRQMHQQRFVGFEKFMLAFVTSYFVKNIWSSPLLPERDEYWRVGLDVINDGMGFVVQERHVQRS